MVISIAMVAARVAVNDGAIAQVAISVGACSAVAVRLPEAEAAGVTRSAKKGVKSAKKSEGKRTNKTPPRAAAAALGWAPLED